ncbi:MAG: TatD family hydrolase [Thermodesulfobacteriota bacterium]
MKEFLVDTHVHLCDPDFDSDLEQVLARAREHGVEKMITVSENKTDVYKNLELVEKYPEILPAAGLYPANADLQEAEEIMGIIRRERDRLAAIGEVGLDFRIAETETERDLQMEVFGMFIQLSLELDLPLSVHSRSAGKYAIRQLLENGADRVQMHAFDGKAASAQEGIEAGYFFSIPPSISRSRQKQKLLKQLPVSSLLLETDAPVLGPSPEERNEPSNLILSLQTVAEIKELSLAEPRETVYKNTLALFGDILLR